MMEDTPTKNYTGFIVRAVLLAVIVLALGAITFATGFLAGSGYTRQAAAAGEESPILPGDLFTPDADEAVSPESTSGEPVSLDTFWEVWDTLEDRFYYDLPSEEERVHGAIQGLIDSLGDPYTAYVPPEEARILSEDSSGTFEGIGAYVQEAPEGGVLIIRVFDEAPARDAGLQAGDVVIAVDGVDITENILTQSLLLIRGPEGTDVTLTIVREGVQDPIDLTITRARLEVPTVEYRMLDDHIGYVALFEFNARASDRLQNAIEELMDQGAESLILDLRNNPGGYLDESVAIADMFLPRGTVLIQRDVDGNERQYTSRDGDFAEDIPLVVLINGNSASASEIVAAAIKDNERGVVIGETSFGKGSVQLQYTLTDGSLLRVTYANWYTPNDISISENGVEPDIVVEAPEDISSGEDVQLQSAVDYLMEHQTP
jgi:carboxyl-terminal processing protease